MAQPGVRELEVALLESWPPLESAQQGGWRLGAARGVTGRANSVTVLDADDTHLGPRIERVEDWYRQRRLPARFRLTPLSEPALDDALRSRDYTDRNGTTDALVLDELSPDVDAPEHVEIVSQPADGWWALTDRPVHDHATLREMLAPLRGKAGYATLRLGDHPVAVGTAVLVGDRVSVANLHTQPAARGQGHARTVLGALHRWAFERSARSAFLNVLHDNQPAQALYRSAGYRFAYGYRYLEAPP